MNWLDKRILWNNAGANVKRTSVAEALERWGIKPQFAATSKIKYKNSQSFKHAIEEKRLFESTNSTRLIPKFNYSKNLNSNKNSLSASGLTKRGDHDASIKVVDLTCNLSDKKSKYSVTK